MAPGPDLSEALATEHVVTDDERESRLEQERLLLDEARADVRAGRVISGPALGTWLDVFARGEPLPPLLAEK